MQQQAPGTVAGKLESGRNQLVQMLSLLRSSRWVLIDSTTNAPRDLESPKALAELPQTGPAAAAADIPAMLASAYEYILANQTGRTDIWLCSDLRRNDWDPESGRWKKLRDQFLELPQGVRIHLLAYAEPAANNLAVRVTDVRRRDAGDAAELLVSFQVTREGTAGEQVTVPVQFEIDGARSEVSVELSGQTVEIQDHRIPLEKTQERGWGKISIPADANPADNEFHFVFDKPAPRRTLLVGDGSAADRPLELAAGIAPDPTLETATETLPPEQLAAVDWKTVALVLWHAPLPEAEHATALKTFLDRGGRVIFFPPAEPNSAEFLGIRWQEWVEELQPTGVENWRTDQDLLANTESGASLPVGQLEIDRYCRFIGEATPLAVLKDSVPLAARAATVRGGAYFVATTPAFGDSSLASDGIVLYVMIQRALTDGAALLGNVHEIVAGETPAEQAVEWQPVSVRDGVLSTEYAVQSGIYASGDKLLAVNRALDEDLAPVVEDERVRELFQGFDFTRVDDRAGSSRGLIEETWRMFLWLMIVALLAEAALCLPRKAAGKFH